MNTQIRAFNNKGIEQFRSFLERAKDGDTASFPEDQLVSGYVTDMIMPSEVVESKIFTSKSELITFIHERVSVRSPIPFRNPGLWTWLAAFYFESICPVNNGRRKVQEEAKYILNVEHWGKIGRAHV